MVVMLEQRPLSGPFASISGLTAFTPAELEDLISSVALYDGLPKMPGHQWQTERSKRVLAQRRATL